MPMRFDPTSSWVARVALDGLPMGVAIVSASLRLYFINETGQRHMSGHEFGLRMMRTGPGADGGTYLSARMRQDTLALRELVQSATSRGRGGSMRLTGNGFAPCAVLVSPTPADAPTLCGTAADGAAASKPLALVMLQPLGRGIAPSTGMLCEIFNFSQAEGGVAVALSGGASAEDVARQRGVSLQTVRSQIRSILAKSDCENLRDLERVMATLTTLRPGLHPGRSSSLREPQYLTAA